MLVTFGELRATLAEALKKQFDFAELKKLQADGRMLDAYCDSHLEVLGEGSARKVYALSPDSVLKVAIHTDGLTQNKNEFEIAASGSPLVTKVLQHDPEFEWIVSERVKPAKDDGFETQFARRFGSPSYTLLKKMAYGHKLGKVSTEASKFARELQKLIRTHNLDPEDVIRGSSWGYTPDDRLIMLDYGLKS